MDSTCCRSIEIRASGENCVMLPSIKRDELKRGRLGGSSLHCLCLLRLRNRDCSGRCKGRSVLLIRDKDAQLVKTGVRSGSSVPCHFVETEEVNF